MIRSIHNKFVSTPDWFTSETPTTVTSTGSAQTIIVGSSSGSANTNLSENTLTVYNRSLIDAIELTANSLLISNYAVSVITDNQANIVAGELIYDKTQSATNYIEVASDTNVYVQTSYDSSLKYGIAFYDLRKVFISGITADELGVINTIAPTNARYYRVSCTKDSWGSFKIVYTGIKQYDLAKLIDVHKNSTNYAELKYPLEETINKFQISTTGISLVADNPLKLEMDKYNNIHLNITDVLSGMTGDYVTTTEEPQQVTGVKTFENGIGIGDYLIVPDIENESLKVVHKDETKLGNLYTTGWLSALGVSSDGSSGSGGASALYQLVDVLADGESVQGAEVGSVLKYNGSHWYADTDEGLDLSKLQNYLDANNYLTKTAADDLFLTPAEGDELFLTQEEGDDRYLLKKVFSKIFTAYDVNGNTVDITDFDTAIDNISINYNMWSPGYISALGKQSDGSSSGSASALYQLVDVLADGSQVSGATKGSVLTYDGSHWYASELDIPTLDEYATVEYIENRLDDLINGAPAAFDTLKEIADVLQENVDSIGDIFTVLDTKWTRDDQKIANWDETYTNFNDWFYKDSDGYIHSRYGFVGDSFVSALGANDEDASVGGLSEVYWTDIKEKPTFASVATSGKYSDLTGVPEVLSAFRDDVGYLTSHQTIYNLTMQAGTFSAVTFDPNGAAKTVNIPTTTNHISEGDNLYFTDARAIAALTDTLKGYVGSTTIDYINTVSSLPSSPDSSTIYIMV